jgi:hypothetical protein
MRPRLLALLFVQILWTGPVFAAPVVTHAAFRPDVTAPPAPAVPAWLQLVAGAAVVFGAIRIKDTSSLAAKFVQRASAAAGDYTTGVQAAGSDWEANSKAAEQSYGQGVQDAIAKGRYGRGISAAGASKFVANATKLGAQRYPTGVQNAQDAWAKGVQPALDKLKSLTLPPRGPRRSPQNQQRANMVALELGKLVDAG